MKNNEIVSALRTTESRSKRELLDTAANLIEKLTARCARYAEEIADVGIILDQMAIEFEVEDAVAEQRVYKVRRLRSRLEYVEQEG